MFTLQAIVIWIVQAILLVIGMATAGLAAHLAGDLVAKVFDVDALIPSAIIFYGVAAALGWAGNRLSPEDWLYNPFL